MLSLKAQIAIQDDSIEAIVCQIQAGNKPLQHKLLQAYKPFIAKCTSEVCKRYIDPYKDDEFSIGLFAFYEAINYYSLEKGKSFLAFARLIIHRKTIDYIRKQSKHTKVSSLDDLVNDQEKMESPFEIVATSRAFQLEQDTWHRKQEINHFCEQLLAYKFSLQELIQVAPKHKDARRSAMEIGYLLYNDDSLKWYVRQKKQLPMKLLAQKVRVSKKTLERNRKYILAIFIILDNDFLYLSEYIIANLQTGDLCMDKNM